MNKKIKKKIKMKMNLLKKLLMKWQIMLIKMMIKVKNLKIMSKYSKNSSNLYNNNKSKINLKN